MRLYMMFEAQEGMRYADLLAAAHRTEAAGLDGLYRSDHYSSVAGRDENGSTDAWAALAGLAREVPRITLGTLVSPVTFRRAGNLAKTVATVAEMAGTTEDGAPRVHLGFGTGWLEREHRRHGFPFEDVGTRFARLEEHLQVVRGLWGGGAFDFDGDFVTVTGGHLRPVPEPMPRVIVGGNGPRTTPRLAATYADELNLVFQPPEGCAQRRSALDEACEVAGRDPSEVSLTLMTGCVVGRTTEEFEERAREVQRLQGDDRAFAEWLADVRGAWITGTVDEAVAHLAALREAGVEGVALQHLRFADLEMIDCVGEEIRPRMQG